MEILGSALQGVGPFVEQTGKDIVAGQDLIDRAGSPAAAQTAVGAARGEVPPSIPVPVDDTPYVNDQMGALDRFTHGANAQRDLASKGADELGIPAAFGGAVVNEIDKKLLGGLIGGEVAERTGFEPTQFNPGPGTSQDSLRNILNMTFGAGDQTGQAIGGQLEDILKQVLSRGSSFDSPGAQTGIRG
jgi:hypothetical protein